jgi:hypothetical protein
MHGADLAVCGEGVADGPFIGIEAEISDVQSFHYESSYGSWKAGKGEQTGGSVRGILTSRRAPGERFSSIFRVAAASPRTKENRGRAEKAEECSRSVAIFFCSFPPLQVQSAGHDGANSYKAGIFSLHA